MVVPAIGRASRSLPVLKRGRSRLTGEEVAAGVRLTPLGQVEFPDIGHDAILRAPLPLSAMENRAVPAAIPCETRLMAQSIDKWASAQTFRYGHDVVHALGVPLARTPVCLSPHEDSRRPVSAPLPTQKC